MRPYVFGILNFLWCLIHVINMSTAAPADPPACEANEIFIEKQTTVPLCEFTCANPGLNCVKGKDTQVWSGCRCKKTYFRHQNGTCISFEDCLTGEKHCGTNELYYDSKNYNKYCDTTCKVKAGNCGKEKQIGCYCKNGFVRNDRSVCAPENACEIGLHPPPGYETTPAPPVTSKTGPPSAYTPPK